MQVTAPTQSELMLVRNTQRGSAIFRDQPSDVTIRWEGAGDPAGQDWQYVPSHYLNHPQFSTMVRKGVFVLGSESDAAGSLEAQDTTQSGSNLAAQAAAAFERPEINDFLQVPCVGPGSRPGHACGTPVPQRQAEAGKVPPLCHTHAALSTNYVPTVQPGVDGKDTIMWVQVTMTAPQSEIVQPTSGT
jgi:hypothetical protein